MLKPRQTNRQTQIKKQAKVKAEETKINEPANTHKETDRPTITQVAQQTNKIKQIKQASKQPNI